MKKLIYFLIASMIFEKIVKAHPYTCPDNDILRNAIISHKSRILKNEPFFFDDGNWQAYSFSIPYTKKEYFSTIDEEDIKKKEIFCHVTVTGFKSSYKVTLGKDIDPDLSFVIVHKK